MQSPAWADKCSMRARLDEEGRALVAASNIAGAASLAASADAAAQKQAIREGAVDFLVTNLDEALRILKNEIRKGQAVSVCVAARPQAMEREMVERGVRPDLLRPGATAAELETFLQQGARQIVPVAGDDPALLAWSVAAAPAEWLPGWTHWPLAACGARMEPHGAGCGLPRATWEGRLGEFACWLARGSLPRSSWASARGGGARRDRRAGGAEPDGCGAAGAVQLHAAGAPREALTSAWPSAFRARGLDRRRRAPRCHSRFWARREGFVQFKSFLQG